MSLEDAIAYVESTQSQSDGQQAVEQSTSGKPASAENGAPDGGKTTPVNGDAKPGDKLEPKEEKPDLAAELAKLSEEKRKIDGQAQAALRLKKDAEKRLAETIEREKKLQQETDIKSVTAMIELLAKRRGVPTDIVWREFADEIRNGGKPTETTELRRELDAIKRSKQEEKEAEEKRQAELEAQKAEAQRSQLTEWGNQADALLADSATQAKFPRLFALPKEMIESAIIDITRQYFDETGGLPEHDRVLSYLESKIPEPAKGAAEVPKKPASKATIPGDKEANTLPDSLETMPMHEREEAAVRWLASLGE